MVVGLLDPQRASWAPMLGIDQRSVALDIGAGYGAITHSLSQQVGEVYSIEAIPERIEFIQERLGQDNIHNVHLIQASAISLPLVENSFDLAVANGILEWVGEWNLEGTARDAQLEFLRSLCRLLKDDGALVIGIENRFGYGSFLGAIDHSGLAYTNIMPRSLATLILRSNTKPHYRTRLNSKKEYRTYTYSERGYYRLLRDAGFADVACFWAEPGYNQPYNLIPMSMPMWIKEHNLGLLDHPAPNARQGWRRRLKRAMQTSGLLQFFLPEFVLFAFKSRDHQNKLEAWMEKRLRESGVKQAGSTPSAKQTAWALQTKPFRPKSVVRLGDKSGARDLAYMKINSRSQGGSARFEAGFANREKVRAALDACGARAISVPESYGKLELGDTSYWMESAAQGTPVYRIFRQPFYFGELDRAESDLNGFLEPLIELTQALQKISGAAAINLAWHDVPEELLEDHQMCALLAERRYFGAASGNDRTTWIQHGDLSVENLAFDKKSGRLEVVDWDDLGSGFPPLYDVFQLFLSLAYLAPEDESVGFPNDVERWVASFRATFLSDTGFARVAQRLIFRVCERLQIAHDAVPALLMEFLLIRTHFYAINSASAREIHLRLLQMLLSHDRAVLGIGLTAAPHHV
jgi:ubiquinone/menaquinone biosynthesis C-methylase UbiE